MIEQWAPTVICGGALGMVWFGIRSHKKDIDKKIDCLKTGRKECEEKYLKEKDHIVLCENATLKINAHTTDEIREMKKEILEAINGG